MKDKTKQLFFQKFISFQTILQTNKLIIITLTFLIFPVPKPSGSIKFLEYFTFFPNYQIDQNVIIAEHAITFVLAHSHQLRMPIPSILLYPTFSLHVQKRDET